MFQDFSDDELLALEHDWEFWGRDNQLWPEGKWTVWLILAGRGFGKTRCGAEGVRKMIVSGCRRIALVAETAADARDVMVEGESGLLNACFRDDRDLRGNFIGKPRYEPSKRRLTWENGAIATTYSAEEPDQLRGPQHDGAWADEIAKWRYPDSWDQLMFGLRLGRDPRAIATTTPRPIAIIKELLKDTTCHVTRGSTYENRPNLAKTFFTKVVARYEGTRLGRQELNAEVLEDTPGALWTRKILDNMRVKPADVPDLSRIVVAVDPSTTNHEGSDEIGICVCGKDGRRHGYLLDDLSMKGSPDEWARAAVIAYDVQKADCLVYESNQGGDMVLHTLRTAAEALYRDGRRSSKEINIVGVHASRGKVTRAEPISAIYEQRRIHHVGSLPIIEDQMCEFTSDFDRKKAGYSPDRLDAMVWAFTNLFLGEDDGEIVVPPDASQSSYWRQGNDHR